MPRTKQISLTAAFIAIKFYGLMKLPAFQSLFPKEVLTFYDNTVAMLPKPLSRFHSLLKYKPIRSGLMSLEEIMLPGDLLHIIQRKWMANYLWQTSNEFEIQQVLVIGAGFDHLATITSRRGIPSMEIDRNATYTFKKKILHQTGDLNNYLIIKNSGFRGNRFAVHLQELSPYKNTLILTEGFWDYQSKENNQILVDKITDFFKAKITLVSTIFDTHKLNAFHRSVFLNSIRTTGEQIEFTTSVDEVKDLFKHGGFVLEKLYNAEEMNTLMNIEAISLSNLQGFAIVKFRKN